VENDAPLDLVLTTGFHTATYPAGATFGPRHLGTYEFVWLMEGNAVYRRGDESIDAPEGSFVLCRPGVVDAFRWDSHRRTHHAYFHFLLHGTPPTEWPAPDDWPLVRLPQGGDADLLPVLFRNLLTWGEADRGSAQTRLTALSLLAAFVTGRTSPRAASAGGHAELPEPVRVALTHLARRMDEDGGRGLITLDELAGVAAVTPEHLCRLFKSATGRTPLETVRLHRLERARTLLTRTNYSVAEIAALCGFSSPFHFSRRFKDAFGHSPRDLRRRAGERDDDGIVSP
jgi:AraC-like DNA-binding protein